MAQYGIRSEFECISGLVMEYAKWTNKREFELRKAVGDVVQKIVIIFRAAFWDGIGNKAGRTATRTMGGYHVTNFQKAAQKASAYYYVACAYQPSSDSRGHKNRNARYERPFISFPWVICGDVLLEVLKQRKEHTLSMYSGVPRVDWELIRNEASNMHADIWQDGTQSEPLKLDVESLVANASSTDAPIATGLPGAKSTAGFESRM